MPILKGAVTFSRYRVEAEKKAPDKRQLAKALKARAFVPLDREGPDERAQGFVELADRDAVEFSAGALHEGSWALFSFRVDEIRIPSAAVKGELEKWTRRFEEEHERPPGRREKAEAKAAVRQMLKARYPVQVRTFDVSWNLDTDRLQLWAGSRKAVEEVEAAVCQAFGVKLVPMVPVVLADDLGIAEKSLTPTPALSIPEREASDGEA